MLLKNGALLDSTPVEMPASILSMQKRALKSEDFKRFLQVQMYEITYMSEGLKLKGFMALPAAEESHLPCLIFNRGGAGKRGALTAESAFAYAGLYASWGYVVLASQYRGQGGSEGKEEWGAGDIDDAMNLLPLIADLKYVDQNRIGIIAGSRGGMMAFQMLTRTDIFKAAVTVGAPTIFNSLPGEDYIFKKMSEFLQPDADFKKEAEQRSVVAWADKLCKTTPLLVLHGTGDRRVIPEHGLHLGLALQKIRHPYKLVMFENADHILSGRRKEGDVEIRAWVDNYVKNLAPLPKTGAHGA